MSQSFDDLYQAIKQAAIDNGLILVDDVPTLAKLPIAIWRGEWQGFIDCAVQVHASLLYLEKWAYKSEIYVEELIDNENAHRLILDEEDGEEDEQEEIEIGSREWLRARLMEAVSPWAKHDSEILGINSVWMKEGIAHYWSRDTEWYAELRDAADDALELANQVEKEQQVLRSEESSLNFHQYAKQLAHHPRFSEATSDAKREYMLLKLFPEIEDAFPEYSAALNIVKRANLIYWWEVEPGEKANIANRIRQMYEAGDTIKNIAAVLEMSEAKIRVALRNISQS